ncbi:MAG: M28 family peptidase [Thermoproteota archaeon]
MTRKNRLVILIPILTFLLLTPFILSAAKNQASSPSRVQNAALTPPLLANGDNLFPLNTGRMNQFIEEVSSYGPRMTGYSGYYETLNYLYNYFKDELGITPVNHTYKVLVPYDEETYIEILEPFRATINAYALYPNGINPSPTPSEGITGPLLYVKAGDLKEFDGKDVAGSIIAMDFISRDNWLKAVNLGAEAVVFIEPEETTYQECYDKFLDTPIGFTRVYVKKSDWDILKNAATVRLVSRMAWREVEAVNILGSISGTEKPNEVVILSAHFDSWSVVPRLSASKTELVPLALLLEYARYLRANPPKYTVWLVLYSGHWQALTGSRQFVEDYFFSEDVSSGRITLLGNMNFDLMASDSDGLQLLHASHYSTYGGAVIHSTGFPLRFNWFTTVIQEIVNSTKVRVFARRIPNVNVSAPAGTFRSSLIYWAFTVTSAGMFTGTEPIPYMLDSEPASMAGIPAFSITTRRSNRLYVGSPIDDGKYADINTLDPYLQLALYIVDSFLRMDWNTANLIKPTRFSLQGTLGYPGYATLQGKVKVYNYSKGWYDVVPNALVEVKLVTSTYKLNKIIMRADENGSFVIYGVPVAGSVTGGGTAIPFSRWVVRGWMLNDEGVITMANDLGQFGMMQYPIEVTMFHRYENVTTVIANVVSMEVLDFEIPSLVTTPNMIDPRAGAFEMWRSSPQPVSIMTFDLQGKSLPISYGYYSNGWEPASIVWVQPGLRFVVLSATGMIATNSSPDNTEGSGFYVEPGSKARLCFTTFRVAKDFYYIAYGRYLELVRRNMGSPSADETLENAKKYIDEVENLVNEKKYSGMYAYALLARAYASRAYFIEVMPLINDSSRSLLFMFLIIILGAFFLEKLLIHASGSKRVATIAILAAVFLAMFGILHPAFQLMSNISLGLIGSLIMIVIIVVLIIVLALSEEIRKGVERRILGVHRAEVSRLDTAMISFSLGSEHMRRRPLRAILVFITLITMVMAMTSFTSLMPTRVTVPIGKYGYTSFRDEIFIKQGRGVPPNIISDKVLDMAKILAGDKYQVFPRVWLYAPLDRALGGSSSATFRVWSATNTSRVMALMGMTVEEFNSVVRGSSLVRGGLLSDDAEQAVISLSLATNLSLTIGDPIYISGMRFTVSGIVDSNEVNFLLEPDGYNIFPANPIYFASIARDTAQAAQAGSTPQNLQISTTIIIPYKRLLMIGGYVSSIAVVPKEAVSFEEIFNTAKAMAYSLDLTIYISHGGSPYVLSTYPSIALGGWEMILIIVVIGALNVFTTVLGSLKERTREVYTFSVVGLSPMGVTVFFMTEVLVYAIISALVGYVAGYLATRVFMFLGILPSGHLFNFAAGFAILGTVVTIIAALAAAAYPAYLASKVATPSLERRWKFKTKPKGNEWDIPLLVSVPTVEEGKGLLAYLQEYFAGAGAVKEGVHMVKDLQQPDYENLLLSLTVSLAPFEVGVSQRVDIAARFNEELKRHEIVLHLELLSGPKSTWINSNYRFVNELRRQLIMWGSFSAAEKANYVSMAKD